MAPAVVLVPGGWHRPDYYTKVVDILKSHGREVNAIALPTVGATEPKTMHDDADAIRQATHAFLDQGKDVVVACHSYGGVPTTQALEGLDKKSRGDQAAVVRIVYISAFVVPKGTALITAGFNFPWIKPEDETGARLIAEGAMETCYNDISKKEGEFYISLLQPQSTAAFTTPLDHETYKSIPSAYVLCEKDQALLPEMQQKMIDDAGVFKGSVDRLPTSHSPMLSDPAGLAAIIEKYE